MPSGGGTVFVGGGIGAGSPFTLDQFLFVSSVAPPAASTSPRLIRRATSIEILGDGATSTSIGSNADANGADSIAIGRNVTTNQTDAIAIGRDITISNTVSVAIGSINSPAANYALASSFTALGQQQTYSLLPSNSVMLGASVSGGGNSAVAVGAGVAITGNGSVGIGANAQAGLNSISIGQLATTGTGGAANNISIGSSATGPAAVSGVILLGNRQTAAGTIATGDIVLGHQDNSNNVFSTRLWLGGPDHKAATAVPAFTIRGRQGSGTNLNAGDLAIVPQLATGNAAGGGVSVASSAPGASGAVVQTATVAFRVDPSSNLTLCAAAGSYGAGLGVAFLGNAATVPSVDPVGGGILYAEGGALKWRGSGGTVTTIAPA